jgi:hypothetical protein
MNEVNREDGKKYIYVPFVLYISKSHRRDNFYKYGL